MNSFKFRLYPNKTQAKELFRQFDIHCALYNYCLAEKVAVYENTGESLSHFQQMKVNIPKFKDNCNSSSLQQTIRRLDKTFDSFFRRFENGEKPGFPRFKSHFKSIEFVKGDGSKIIGSRLRIQHVGLIKMISHRAMTDYSRVSIRYEYGHWYASFCAESPSVDYGASDKEIGIDFGLKTFATTSDGDKYLSPKPLKDNLKNLSKTQSRHDKAEKGSKERAAKSKVLRNINRYIKNVRRDWNNKLSLKIVKENGLIVIEDLSVKDLQSKFSNINRAYCDVAWNQFTHMLSYKAENAGRVFIKVNPAYTSQLCQCGAITPHTLKKRTFTCGQCGDTADRDVNAARNILALGLQSQTLNSQKACGSKRKSNHVEQFLEIIPKY